MEAGTLSSLYAAAIADPTRPAADLELDAQRSPATMMALAGVKPGERVVDVMPGRGYASRLFSHIVGPEGHVVALVLPDFAEMVKQGLDSLNAWLSESVRKNVEVRIAELGALAADAPFDCVWIALNYHDIAGYMGEAKARDFCRDAAALLRSGGTFIVIDHAAREGRGARDARALHRIEQATVVDNALQAGFVLDGHSDCLVNAADSHIEPVFTQELRGHTDRFALKFRKP